jgi:hypothetical protein
LKPMEQVQTYKKIWLRHTKIIIQNNYNFFIWPLNCSQIFTEVSKNCFPYNNHYVAMQIVKSLDFKNIALKPWFWQFCDFNCFFNKSTDLLDHCKPINWLVLNLIDVLILKYNINCNFIVVLNYDINYNFIVVLNNDI